MSQIHKYGSKIVLIMINPSVTDTFLPVHTAAGARALSYGLTKIFVHTAAGAFPFA